MAWYPSLCLVLYTHLQTSPLPGTFPPHRRDSQMSSVLETGLGCSPALSIMYLQVAERLGLEMDAQPLEEGRYWVLWPRGNPHALNLRATDTAPAPVWSPGMQEPDWSPVLASAATGSGGSQSGMGLDQPESELEQHAAAHQAVGTTVACKQGASSNAVEGPMVADMQGCVQAQPAVAAAGGTSAQAVAHSPSAGSSVIPTASAKPGVLAGRHIDMRFVVDPYGKGGLLEWNEVCTV